MSFMYRGNKLEMNEYLVELQAILDQYNITEAWGVKAFRGNSKEDTIICVPLEDDAVCEKLESDISKTFGSENHTYIRKTPYGLPIAQGFVLYEDGKFYDSGNLFVFN